MVDKSVIGEEVPGASFTVERGKVMEFARAITDDRNEYFAEDPPIPPTFSMAQAHWPLPTDGASQGELFRKLGLDLLRVLHGGQEFEYLGEIKVGDVLTGRSKITDVYEKEGKRGGTMTFVISETTFANQRGEDVLKARSTIIETAKAAS